RRLFSRGAAPVVALALPEVLARTRIGLLPLIAWACPWARGRLGLAVLSRIRIGLLPLIAVARSPAPGVLELAVLARIRIGLLPLIAPACSTLALAFTRSPRAAPSLNLRSPRIVVRSPTRADPRTAPRSSNPRSPRIVVASPTRRSLPNV